MVLSGLRILVAALDDPTFGVNEQIDRIPIDLADPRPPKIAKILDLTRDPEVLQADGNGALVLSVPAFPALVCAPEEPLVAAGEINQNRRDAESVSYAVTYVTDQPDFGQAAREGLYTCRAMEQVIAQLMDSSRQAFRTRNDVYLQYAIQIVYGTVLQNALQGHVSAAFSVVFQPRNLNPTPA